MSKPQGGRHRADVEINVLESFELRSRRSVREAERVRQTRAAKRLAKRLAKERARAEAVVAYKPNASTNQSRFLIRQRNAAKTSIWRKRRLHDALVMFISTGIFATTAIPAYALSPDVVSVGGFIGMSNQTIAQDYETQSLTISVIKKVEFLRSKSKLAKLSELDRQRILGQVRTYTGPTAADYISNPPYSKLDSAQVLKVAAKYVGSPYVFGGETPSGFDCSGYVRYVFAQFGIDLPHSVVGQSRMGIVIKAEDAMPGDLVVLNNLSHDGIYAGNGMFYHAPRRGDDVKLAPIFTDQVFFVRLNTK